MWHHTAELIDMVLNGESSPKTVDLQKKKV